ncbi:MAG: hypothetical protein AB1352_01065 [Patescibacteria group bacterium]
MTQLQKNTFPSFILAIGLGIIFSEKVGKIFTTIADIEPGSLSVVNPGSSLDGFVFIYVFTLSLCLQLLKVNSRWFKYNIWGVAPILLIPLLVGNIKYFSTLIILVMCGLLIGLGIRTLHEKLMLKKRIPPSA